MKIVYINDQIFPSHETDTEQILSMVSALGALGEDVELLLPVRWDRPPVTAQELARHYQVEWTFRAKSLPSVFPSFRGLEKLGHAGAGLFSRAAREADVLYTRNLPSAGAALRFGDKPVVYETFRPWPDQQPLLRPFLKWMARHPRLLLVVTHSRFAGDSFARIGLPPEKLMPAHNGYDPRRMQPVRTKEEARKFLGLPENRPVVTYAGHVNQAKGCGLLIEMARAMPETIFILVGSRGRGEVEQLAETAENVRIVPWQPFRETVPYLYASDVLIVPPTAGPLNKVGNTVLPIKTFLYMASGRTIFGPDTPDLKEILEDDRNAVLVPPDALPEAIQRLQALLNDSERLNRLGNTALEDARELTWENRALRILRRIREGLERL